MRAVLIAVLVIAGAIQAESRSLPVDDASRAKSQQTKKQADAELTAQEWANLMEVKSYALTTNCVVPTNAIVLPTPITAAEIVAATNSAASLKTALQTIRQYQLDNKQALQDIKAWQQAQERFDRDSRDVIRNLKTLAREVWIRVLGRPKQQGD
jgi:hypothetical protein